MQASSNSDMTDAQTDKTLQLRLENARLARAETALKAKGSSLEEALKALEARLAEHEELALSQHAALEHGKHQARHCKYLITCHEVYECQSDSIFFRQQ